MDSNRVPTPYLQWLKDKGILTKMYRYGMLTPKPSAMLEIRLKINALMRQGLSKEQAVLNVVDSLGLSRSTIYRYL